MQDKKHKYLHLSKVIGEVVRSYRINNVKKSTTKLADEYALNSGTLSKIENGNNSCKVQTLWEFAEAMGIKLSDLFKIIEEKLGEDFTLIDE